MRTKLFEEALIGLIMSAECDRVELGMSSEYLDYLQETGMPEEACNALFEVFCLSSAASLNAYVACFNEFGIADEFQAYFMDPRNSIRAKTQIFERLLLHVDRAKALKAFDEPTLQ